MAQTYPPVLQNDFLACNVFDATGQLVRIAVPTLIICGSEDRMTPPRLSYSLQRGIANSRLEIVEGAGHMTMLEEPLLVTDLIARFLDELAV
jgi:pimeloyl-ACP methyl ester carboxylesterase